MSTWVISDRLVTEIFLDYGAFEQGLEYLREGIDYLGKEYSRQTEGRISEKLLKWE